jgi:hypothetical protein
MSAPGATVRAMPSDPTGCPGLVVPAAPGVGPAALAVELGRARAELPVVGGLEETEQLLVSA